MNASLAYLTRVLEPELMDTPEEARDYDAMDHSSVNVRFCEDLMSNGEIGFADSSGKRSASPIGASVLDVGTGTALIPIELCRRLSNVHVVAVDLAEHMLALAKKNVARAGLQDRVMLEKVDAKSMPYENESFATTVSNSIVHHIPDPRAVLSEMNRVTMHGGLIFIRDLARPESDTEVDRLVTLYGGEPPADPSQKESFENQRELFRASIKTALTIDEVAAMAKECGMASDAVRMTSDRHWTLAFRKP
jgi:ubiquinone/menaquinone biosynthesis C-methylase UbiE